MIGSLERIGIINKGEPQMIGSLERWYKGNHRCLATK